MFISKLFIKNSWYCADVFRTARRLFVASVALPAFSVYSTEVFEFLTVFLQLAVNISVRLSKPQVILVANEDAIEKLPAELRLGLVMTIYEAKGLEFDDVLLYNFFKDSPVSHQTKLV